MRIIVFRMFRVDRIVSLMAIAVMSMVLRVMVVVALVMTLVIHLVPSCVVVFIFMI